MSRGIFSILMLFGTFFMANAKPEITSIIGSSSVCYDVTSTYSLSVTNGAYCQEYKWSVSGGGTIIGSTTSSTVKVKWTSSGTIKAGIEVTWACESESGVVHGTASKTKNVTLKTFTPSLIYDNAKSIVCSSEGIYFHTTVYWPTGGLGGGELEPIAKKGPGGGGDSVESAWQYNIAGTGWRSIYDVPNNVLAFHFFDYFTDSDLGKVIQFRVRSYPPGCSSGTITYDTELITFYRDAPSIFDTSFYEQSSICESNAGITISKIKYPDSTAYGGEAIEIEFTPNDINLPTYNVVRSDSLSYTFDSNTEATKMINGIGSGSTFMKFDKSFNLWTVIITNKVSKEAGNSCSSAPIPITFPAPAAFSVLSISDTDIKCSDSANGTVSIAVANGKLPMNYYLYKVGSPSVIKEILNHDNRNYSFKDIEFGGQYYVKVIDSCGSAVKSSNTEVKQPRPIEITLDALKDETCDYSNNGSIKISSNGGTRTLKYKWSNGATTEDISGLTGTFSGKNYKVTVTDDNSCEASATYKIKQPNPVTFSTPESTNPVCNGGNGTITIPTPTGGWGGAYQYSIDNGANYHASNKFNVPAGTYKVRAINTNGSCVSDASTVELIDPTTVKFTFGTATALLCNGDNDGSVVINASSGSGTGYWYKVDAGNWVDPAGNPTTFTIPNLTGGLHGITIRDSNLCTSGSKSITISEPTLLTGDISETAFISCNGDSDGILSANPTGGVPPYTYAWSHGPASKAVSGISDGSYSVIVTDNNGCNTTLNYTIYEPAELLASSSKSDFNGYNISCNGATDGTIDVDVSGGTTPYTYQWSGNSTATTQDITVGAGTYNVLITDDHGCTFEINDIVITEPNELALVLDSKNEVDCKGNNSGSISLSASGGTGTYEYSSDNGLSYQSSETFSLLVAGDYQVKLKDSNGCETPSQTVTITEPDQLIATATVSNVTCYGGSDGSITINANGGTIDYSYSLDGSLTQSDNNFIGLTAGTYAVTVNDANGCTTSFNKTVGTPSPIAGSIALVSPVSCNGESDGALSVSASGGTGTLTYLWSTGASTPAISGLPAGNYNVTVTDQNSCFKVINYTLNEPGLLAIVTESVQHVSCKGGSDAAIDVNITGGTFPYFYSWSEGSTSQDLTGLAVNDYTLSVTDNRGCTAQQTFSISEPEQLSVSIQQTKNISCFEGNDGQIVLETSGGTAPFEYSKDGGTSWQSETFINLTAKAYTFDVRDANGCTQSISTNLTEPTGITIAINNVQNTTCGDPIGGAESIVSGGVLPYQYSWKNASNTEVSTASSMANVYSGIYTMYATDNNGCTKSEVVVISNTDGADISITGITATQCYSSSDGQATVVINSGVGPFSTLWSNGETTNTATNLTRGNHQVTVTDGNNCETIAAVNIPSPLGLDYSVISTQSPTCFGEADASITINASGGTSPYNYLWETGTVGNTLSGVSAGAYQVTITDDQNCSTIETIAIPETPVLSFSLITEIKPTCIGNTDGILEITGQGGTAPYSYDWGAFGASARVENLSKGIYPVTITDTNGCTTLAEVELNDPEPINFAIITLQQPSCVGQSNGFIEITGTGGTSPYSYLWQSGVTGNQLTNVRAGIYQVTITDKNGCSDTRSVTLNEPTPLTLNIIETASPSCNGFDNGSIEVEAVGGTSPYFYNWSNGITGATLNDLTAGSYTINLQDNNGCTTSLTIDLSEPDPLTLNVTELVLPTCYDTTDGEIAVEVQGGTAPYSYSWNTGASTPQIANIGQGIYQLTITDANRCELQQMIQLQGVEQINLDITTTDPQCFGYDDGKIEITASGGTGDLVYETNNSPTTTMLTGLTAGNYTLSAKDENGCITTEVVTLVDPDQIVISLEDDEICQGGSYPVSLNLGDGYSYSWVGNNGFSSTMSSILLQEPGDYTVLATDINGCTGSDDFTISVNNDLLNADFLLISEAYVGDTVIMIDISWPIPDQLNWTFDENVTVLSENNDYAEVVFNEQGVFTIDIETILADCQDYYSQSITILDRAAKPGKSGRQASEETLIKSFQVYPNPNDGEFDISVKLTDISLINLKLIDLQGNQILLNVDANNNSEYLMPVNMPHLRPGIYIMILKAGKENKVLRFLVK